MPEPAARPSRWPRLWRWLRYGRVAGNTGWTVFHAAPPVRWWSVPARVWRVLARRRGITPTPVVYLLLGAAGLALGLILQLVLGVWWWPPPVALLVVGWMFFFTSIWWHRPHASATSLRVALLEAIAPKRGAIARRREDRRRIRSANLPLFEIQDWPGPVSLDGWGSSGVAVTHISLAFRDAPESPPVVTVGTVADDDTGSRNIRAHLRGELTGLLLREEAAVDPAAIHEAHRRVSERLRALAWLPDTLRVDGRELDAWRVTVDGCSASYAALDGVWVAITTCRPGEFALRTVAAPERFLDLP